MVSIKSIIALTLLVAACANATFVAPKAIRSCSEGYYSKWGLNYADEWKHSTGLLGSVLDLVHGILDSVDNLLDGLLGGGGGKGGLVGGLLGGGGGKGGLVGGLLGGGGGKGGLVGGLLGKDGLVGGLLGGGGKGGSGGGKDGLVGGLLGGGNGGGLVGGLLGGGDKGGSGGGKDGLVGGLLGGGNGGGLVGGLLGGGDKGGSGGGEGGLVGGLLGGGKGGLVGGLLGKGGLVSNLLDAIFKKPSSKGEVLQILIKIGILNAPIYERINKGLSSIFLRVYLGNLLIALSVHGETFDGLGIKLLVGDQSTWLSQVGCADIESEWDNHLQSIGGLDNMPASKRAHYNLIGSLVNNLLYGVDGFVDGLLTDVLYTVCGLLGLLANLLDDTVDNVLTELYNLLDGIIISVSLDDFIASIKVKISSYNSTQFNYCYTNL